MSDLSPLLIEAIISYTVYNNYIIVTEVTENDYFFTTFLVRNV